VRRKLYVERQAGRGATGGYSGPAIKPVALAAVYACRRATSLPIIGMGGVWSGRDALELIAAGATGVALGTVLFTEPNASSRIRGELLAAADAVGLTDPWEATGIAHADLVSAWTTAKIPAFS
jgi:dihydroorotate dehydrogenase (NAD+) catalytic subunit